MTDKQFIADLESRILKAKEASKSRKVKAEKEMDTTVYSFHTGSLSILNQVLEDIYIHQNKDSLSCCGDELPDNQVCPSCKEHN